MEEREIQDNKISTNVRSRDFKLLQKDLVIATLKYGIRFVSLFSLKRAGKIAFNIFQTPQMRSKRKVIGVFIGYKPNKVLIKGIDVLVYNFKPTPEMDNGKKVLLVHGWEARAYDFHKFVPELTANGYEVVLFDGPAHGGSSGKQTTAINFAEVIDHLNTLHGGFYGVIAHSFGSFASSYAFNHYPRVSPKVFIPISGPNLLINVFKSYYDILDIPPSVQGAMESYCEELFNAKVDGFSNSKFVSELKDKTKVMLVHDSDDLMLRFKNSDTIHQQNPETEFLKTQGLGHNRILRTDFVVNDVISFINLS